MIIYIQNRIMVDANAIGALIIPQNRQRRAPFNWHFTVVVDGYPIRVDGFETEVDMLDSAQRLEQVWKDWKNDQRNQN